MFFTFLLCFNLYMYDKRNKKQRSSLFCNKNQKRWVLRGQFGLFRVNFVLFLIKNTHNIDHFCSIFELFWSVLVNSGQKLKIMFFLVLIVR